MKAKTLLLATILSLCSISANANILNTLASREASKLEIGRLSLEVLLFQLDNNMNGKHIRGSEFDYVKARVKLIPEALNVNITYSGDSKDVNQTHCAKLQEFTNKLLSKSTISKLF